MVYLDMNIEENFVLVFKFDSKFKFKTDCFDAQILVI